MLCSLRCLCMCSACMIPYYIGITHVITLTGILPCLLSRMKDSRYFSFLGVAGNIDKLMRSSHRNVKSHSAQFQNCTSVSKLFPRFQTIPRFSCNLAHTTMDYDPETFLLSSNDNFFNSVDRQGYPPASNREQPWKASTHYADTEDDNWQPAPWNFIGKAYKKTMEVLANDIYAYTTGGTW